MNTSIASHGADVEYFSTEEMLLSSPKKRRTSLQRPSASAWKFSIEPSFNLDAGLVLTPEAAVTAVAATEELQEPQQDIEESGLSAISNDNDDGLETSMASPGPPSMILEISGDLLARILSCLPINILLQASGVCASEQTEYLAWAHIQRLKQISDKKYTSLPIDT